MPGDAVRCRAARGPLGRSREFEHALGRLTPGSGVLIAGDAGSGRTTLASALADATARAGAAPLWVTPSASMREVPLGALSSFLDGPTVVGADALATVIARWRFHGSSAPTVLVVDDAHLLDDWSAEAVLQAVSTRAVCLMATADLSIGLAGGLRRLIDDRFVEVVTLAPFDRATIAELAAAALGGPPAQATVELLWRWSAGKPAVLNAIVEAGRGEDRFAPAGGQWWWNGPPPAPDVVAAWAERRLEALSAAAADALGCVALAEWLELAELERLAGAGALLELEGAGLIAAREAGAATGAPLTVHCRDALAGPALVARMAPLRRRALARRLLEVLAPECTPHEVARAGRLSLHTHEPTRHELMEHAVSLLRLSDPAIALQIAELNHRWAPTASAIVALALSRVEDGDADGARALLDQARPIATAGEQRMITETEVAVSLFGDRDPETAWRQVRAAQRSHAPLDAGDARLLRSLEALVALLSARPDEAAALAGGVLADRATDRAADRAADTATDLAALRAGVTLAAALMLAGRLPRAREIVDDMAAPAQAMTKDFPSAAGLLWAELAFIDLWQGRLTPLPAAHPSTGRWPVAPAGEAEEFRWALMAGIVAHLRGDHREAVKRLREAVVQQSRGKGNFHAEASAWLVVALCDEGSPADAEAAMARFPARHVGILPGLADWASGVLACAQGRLADGQRLLLRAAADAADVGGYLCEARYLLELTERCATDEAIGRLDELSRLVDAPLLQLMISAAVARVKGDVKEILESAAALGASGLVPRSIALAREAERLARGQGDAVAARRAAQLRKRGQSGPSSGGGSVDGHPHLTAREVEVAQLAVGGLSDRQIASRLVVSVRTVESHLASAYRKLGVTSRVELTSALA